MKRKLIILVSLVITMIATPQSVYAQKWKYTYDANGNRTSRQVVNQSAKARAASNNLFADKNISATIDARHDNLKVECLQRVKYQNVEATIYDLSGHEVLSYRMDSEVMAIDISQLRRGTYILTVDQDGEKKTCKFNK